MYIQVFFQFYIGILAQVRKLLLNFAVLSLHFFAMIASCPQCEELTAESHIRRTYGTTLDECAICHRRNVQDPLMMMCGHGYCQDCTTDLFMRRVDEPAPAPAPPEWIYDQDSDAETDEQRTESDYDHPVLAQSSVNNHDVDNPQDPERTTARPDYEQDVDDPQDPERTTTRPDYDRGLPVQDYDPYWDVEDDTDVQPIDLDTLIPPNLRRTACWDFIGVDKVHNPTAQYPVPEFPLCYECRCSAPDGIHVRDIFTHDWKWVCCQYV